MAASADLLPAKILPREGDEVQINGLKAAPQHNGEFGRVESLEDVEQRRYRVKIREGLDLAVSLSHITVIDGKPPSMLHVLIPCHIDSPRRMVTFQRCAQSALFQTYNNFSLFIGLSGPKDYRDKAYEYLSGLIKNHKQSQIYLLDDNVEQRPQMEHLRMLFQRGSVLANPDALLTFLDNDDMCHPTRFTLMMNAYQSVRTADNEPYTLALPCKLILDPGMSPMEGRLDNFVNPRNVGDFNHWKRQPFAMQKVRFAPNELVEQMDGEEYFDYIVPSEILARFFQLTPKAVASHRFCDLRLYQILQYMEPLQIEHMPNPDMWLLAHYKVSMEEKRKTFDNDGMRMRMRMRIRMRNPDALPSDQVSFSGVAATASDEKLSKRFPALLSAGKIAMCRYHLESIVIQYIGWNEAVLEVAKREKAKELNQLYGVGFGEALWEECHASILALFDEETLEASKDAWVKPRLPSNFGPWLKILLAVAVLLIAFLYNRYR